MGYRNYRVTRRGVAGGISAAVLAAGLAAASAPASAQSGEPIKIGFSLALTGPLAPNGKQALLGAKIWQRKSTPKAACSAARSSLSTTTTNPIRQTFRESTRSCSTSTKSISSMGPYGTNLIAPAMPIVMQKDKVFIGFFALDINAEFHYPRYFSMLPSRAETRGKPSPKAFSRRRRSRNPSRKRWRWFPKTPSSRATPAKAPAKMPRPTALRSSTTKLSRRARPTSRRLFARCRRPMRTLSWFAPIR